MSTPGFWDDPAAAQRDVGRLKWIRSVLEPLDALTREVADTSELLELGAGDAAMVSEVAEEVRRLLAGVERLEIESLLSGEYDRGGAVLSIHPGAGGTESCDWAQMLLRMYSRWAESMGYGWEVVDLQPGEEAGIKSATVIVSGDCAYGRLKCERGVHRLVRISPFDAARRRHTSFASVDVIPEVPEDVEVEIDPKDLRVDTFRASGKGGQHVNKTSSAVRITHIPTGIVVQCQNERSQLQNRNTAMRVLRARLHELELRRRREEMEKETGEKAEIAWGSQIRSYVLHPYQLVKDHRTGVEVGNAQGVLDGDLGPFIDACLRQRKWQS